MKNATTTATKTPRTPMNRAARREAARRQHLTSTNRKHGEAVITAAAARTGFDVTAPTKGKTASAQSMLLGAMIQGNLTAALTAFASIKASKVTDRQVINRNTSDAAALAAAGLTFGQSDMLDEERHVRDLFLTCIAASADLFDGQARSVIISALGRKNLRDGALAAFALGIDPEVIDGAFPDSWRKVAAKSIEGKTLAV